MSNTCLASRDDAGTVFDVDAVDMREQEQNMENEIFETWDRPEISEEMSELAWQDHQAGIEYALYLDSKQS